MYLKQLKKKIQALNNVILTKQEGEIYEPGISPYFDYK